MPKGKQALPTNLADKPDGFRIALDTSHERADIILERPPLNVVTCLLYTSDAADE